MTDPGPVAEMSAGLVVLAGALLATSSFSHPHQWEESPTPSFATWDQVDRLDKGLAYMLFGRSERNLTIVDGTPSSPKSRTYTVLIGYGPAEDKEIGCSGSVISARFVLSTAYCAHPSKSIGPARWALAGDLSSPLRQDGGRTQTRRIVGRLFHPARRPAEVYHDIALLRLDRNLLFGPWLQPLCLHRASGVPEGPATLTGWDTTALASPHGHHLIEAEVNLFNDTECQRLYPTKNNKMPRGIDPETMFCAGQFRNSKDACQADSGGPLVLPLDENCFTVQIGISSFGDLCDLSDTPAVYTRISYYVPWIESVLYKYFEY